MIPTHRLLSLCLVCGVVFFQQAASPSPKQATKKPQDSESGILYGKDFAYSISAPKGWVMDSETASNEGLSVVFYRQGQTWKQAKTVMYVNVVGKQKGETFADGVQADINRFKAGHPKMGVTRSATLQTRDKRAAVTYVFTNVNKEAAQERVSYVETPHVVLIIALSAGTPGEYQRALQDHTALVQSVFYVTNKVVIKQK